MYITLICLDEQADCEKIEMDISVEDSGNEIQTGSIDQSEWLYEVLDFDNNEVR